MRISDCSSDVCSSDLGGSGRPGWQRALLLLAGLGLFVTALGLMKDGARSLIPALEGSVFTDNAWSPLGVGWLGACIVLRSEERRVGKECVSKCNSRGCPAH